MTLLTIDDWIELFATDTDNANKIINMISNSCNTNNSFYKYCGKLFIYNFLIQDCNLDPYMKLYNSGILSLYIPELHNTHLIKQDKQYGKNLLEHSLLTSVSVDYIVSHFEERFNLKVFWNTIGYDTLKYAALLHDIGKKHNVEKHHIIGSEMANNICDQFSDIASDNFVDHTTSICLNHMYPFGYQRGEQWSDSAIVKFAERCGSVDLCIATIIIASCDKYASTRKLHYLDPLLELCNRLCEITDEL